MSSMSLHAACQNEAKDDVQLLLNEGADVNARLEDDSTPLHYAAQQNAKDVAQLLIDKAADVNARNAKRDAPLHIAALKNAKDVAQLLLNKGADVNARGNNGWTPLHIAAQENAKDVAHLLLDKAADVNAVFEKGLTPLHIAALHNAKDVAQLLLNKGADVKACNAEGRTPLHIAAQQNAKDVAQLLIDKAADVNARDGEKDTPLHLAAHRNAKDVVHLLLHKGADADACNAEGRTPLHLAAHQNAKDVVQLLLNKGAAVISREKNKLTPLHLAATHNTKDVAQLLLKAGASIGSVGSQGNSALHIAAAFGSVDATLLLIDHGADASLANADRSTPLVLAEQQGHPEVVEILRPLVFDEDATRPVMREYAAQLEQVEVVRGALAQLPIAFVTWTEVDGKVCTSGPEDASLRLVVHAKDRLVGYTFEVYTGKLNGTTDVVVKTVRRRELLMSALCASRPHYHVVKIHCIARHPSLHREKRWLLVMERGSRTLTDELRLLQRLPENRGDPTPTPLVPDAALVARVMLHVARGLQHIHTLHAEQGLGVLHADVKPSNILLFDSGSDGDGVVAKLCDFGVSVPFEVEGGETTGDVWGTPAYQAPETFMGDEVPKGPLIDVYGLGCVLWQWLHGGEAPWRRHTEYQFTRYMVNHEKTLVECCGLAYPGLLAGEPFPPEASAEHKVLAGLAEECTATVLHKRPTLQEVIDTLEMATTHSAGQS